jgi:hypothetical protein
MALFHGPVRVPEAAGLGKAKVTLSFHAWKGRQVPPATAEVSVVDSEKAKAGQE